VPKAANGRANDAPDATRDDTKRLPVSARPNQGVRAGIVHQLDPDEALKEAIVAAIYAGDIRRARALLDVLDRKPDAQVISVQAALHARSAIPKPTR
jgi:hypothetical protein